MNHHLSNSPTMHSAPGPRVVIDHQTYVYFGGTSYLGLHANAELIEVACDAIRRYGLHTATSRRGFGNSPPVLATEQAAAQWFSHNDAFYFCSGYLGGQLIINALKDMYNVLLIPSTSHFCLHEAARSTKLPVVCLDTQTPQAFDQHVRKKIKPEQHRPLLLTDGLSPMGHIAPLPDYIATLRDYPGSGILIDDAHGLGVLGDNGRGTIEHHQLLSHGINIDPDEYQGKQPQLFMSATLSKAVGGYGGIITGSHTFIQRVRTASHLFDGASAPPNGVAAASAHALTMVQRDSSLLHKLRQNIQAIRHGVRELGIDVEANSPSPIIRIILTDATTMRNVHESLREQGLLVPYVTKYAGAPAQGLLRLAVSAGHTDHMIDQLLQAMAGSLNKIRHPK